MHSSCGGFARCWAMAGCAAVLAAGLWATAPSAAGAAMVTEYAAGPSAPAATASLVTHRSSDARVRASRRNPGSLFVTPEAQPQDRRRPSDYYQPPPRNPQPFYHHNRTISPRVAPGLQRDRLRR